MSGPTGRLTDEGKWLRGLPLPLRLLTSYLYLMYSQRDTFTHFLLYSFKVHSLMGLSTAGLGLSFGFGH